MIYNTFLVLEMIQSNQSKILPIQLTAATNTMVLNPILNTNIIMEIIKHSIINNSANIKQNNIILSNNKINQIHMKLIFHNIKNCSFKHPNFEKKLILSSISILLNHDFFIYKIPYFKIKNILNKLECQFRVVCLKKSDKILEFETQNTF